ncbi:TetR/AcrR family transcriptional regulator [Mesorhizobium sp. CN2-181]|uniref:TetR/AcrR family transcriptional regulator n=1 Tax=Mesorhizobium yinganensis TaxID=3157707 RepID=UPI0032B7E2CF
MTETMTPMSARAELAMLTQDRIMRGVADILATGNGDVTFKALATASGVPERTIYRHYATKEVVLSSFWSWMNERLGMPAPPRSPEELVEQVPAVFEAFQAGEPLVRAMLHDPHGRTARLGGGDARREKFGEALKDVLAGLELSDRTRLLASVQVLFSAAGWETMKDYWGLSSPEAADAAQWAIQALIEHAKRSAAPPRSDADASPAASREES